MSDTSTQAPTDEQMSAFFEKLVDFRQTLPEHEQILVDALVYTPAKDEVAADEQTVDPPAISKEEVDSFTRKLEDMRNNLTEIDRQLLDGLALEAGAATVPEGASEEDVQGHTFVIFRRRDYAGWINYYANKCGNAGGSLVTRSRYPAYWTSYGAVYTYKCWY